MGYLDNDTIVVDAILTKHGRKLLSDGMAINPTHFALADDGIDYTLWNTSSPSGSGGYDDQITGLAMVEAVPDDQTLMRYKLISLNQNTQFMPIVTLPNAPGSGVPIYSLSNTQTDQALMEPVMENFSGETGFIFKISDVTPLVLSAHDASSIVDMSGTPVDFPAQQEIPTYIELVGASYLTLKAQSGITAKKTVHITIEGMTSGAITSAIVEVLPNV